MYLVPHAIDESRAGGNENYDVKNSTCTVINKQTENYLHISSCFFILWYHIGGVMIRDVR